MINLPETVLGGVVVLALAVTTLASYPPHPRPKPPVPSAVVVLAPTQTARPMTKQQQVDGLDKKLERAEDDLAAIAKIIEQQQAAKAAKALDETEPSPK